MINDGLKKREEGRIKISAEFELSLNFPERQREEGRIKEDVEGNAAAHRAKETDECGGGSSQKEWYSLRNCLLQEQGPLLALWSVRPNPFLSLSLSIKSQTLISPT